MFYYDILGIYNYFEELLLNLIYRVADRHCACPSSSAPPTELSCECYNGKEGEDRLRQKLVTVGDEALSFIKSKEDFKRQMNFSGMIYR